MSVHNIENLLQRSVSRGFHSSLHSQVEMSGKVNGIYIPLLFLLVKASLYYRLKLEKINQEPTQFNERVALIPVIARSMATAIKSSKKQPVKHRALTLYLRIRAVFGGCIQVSSRWI